MSWFRSRLIGGFGWNVWRSIVGAFYLLSALFNTVYTIPRAGDAEVFEGYADGAWSGFLADFIRDFFAPNALFLMVLVVAFEVLVGVAILAHDRWVDLGVLASLVWVVAIMPFLAWPYLLVNVVLVLMQGVIALRVYPHNAWHRSTAREGWLH